MTNPAVARRNEARVTARVPKKVQDRLQYAADLTGATLNQFLVQSALKEAEAIIEKENLISLSRRDAEVFLRRNRARERPARLKPGQSEMPMITYHESRASPAKVKFQAACRSWCGRSQNRRGQA